MTLAWEALRKPATEREEFLQGECKGQPELFAEVSDVVEWEERMGDFLRQPLITLVNLEEPEPGINDELFRAGQEISGRFVILREVGQGGMAVVYEAFDRKRNQRIAIKRAKRGFGRLLSPELEGALKIRHPNICLVNDTHTAKTDSGEVDFLTMEFLDGETLSARIAREGSLPQEEALTVARQLCAGLAAAHEAGIVHRDLKPSNVILTRYEDGRTRAVITDFGLATEASLDSGLVGGTPRYMAPELWHDEKPGKASDVYALGVILYEIVTGARSFQTSQSWDGKPMPPPERPSSVDEDLPTFWDKVILPCLGRIPNRRPEAGEILAIFDRKPLWKSPVLVAAAIALISIGIVLWPYMAAFFKPADIRLAVLSAPASPDLAALEKGATTDVVERLAHSAKPGATIALIPLEDLQRQQVSTPAAAKSVFDATHVLQVRLSRQNGDLLVEHTLFDLSTGARLDHSTARYGAAAAGAIPAAIAGAVSNALHLRLSDRNETISPEATAAYDRGLYFLNSEPSDPKRAIPEFNKAAELDPKSPLPLAGLVDALLAQFEATKNSEALQLARTALVQAQARGPASIKVLLASGDFHVSQGKYGLAQQDYERALELQPRNVEAFLQLAHVFDIQEMPDRAIDYYRKAIALDPAYYQSYASFGAFYYGRGRYQQAEEQFRKQVQQSPGGSDGYSNLGGILSAEGKYAECAKVLEAGLKISETPRMLNNLGAALASLHRDSEALQRYRRAVTLDPGNYKSWLNIGDSLRRLGRVDEAKEPYRKALDLVRADMRANPDRGQSRAFVAYLEMRLGEVSRASEDMAEALQSWPNDNQVIFSAVQMYEALAQRENALNVLQNATPGLLQQIARHPDLAEISRDPRFIKIVSEKQKGDS